jgi:hypothetical protein
MMTKTKMKPISFNTGLIPAIQNLKPDTWPPEPVDPGKPWKWKTRRTGGLEEVNNNHMTWELKGTGTLDYMVKEQYKGRFGAYFHAEQIGGKTLYVCPQVCPYPPGTRLWVRETWFRQDCTPDCAGIKDDNECPFNRVGNSCYGYKAQYANYDSVSKWRPSRFMPKEAARLWLEVKSARVERLQNINHEDAIAEGVMQWICEEHKSGSYLDNAMRGAACAKPERAFALLWDSIYGKKYPWKNNDWVWVYEFMRRGNHG